MPHDPWEFVLEKLQQLKDSGESAALMHWSVKLSSIFQTKIIIKINRTRVFVHSCRDMFVDASMKPPRLHRGMLAALMDETDLVVKYIMLQYLL